MKKNNFPIIRSKKTELRFQFVDSRNQIFQLNIILAIIFLVIIWQLTAMFFDSVLVPTPRKVIQVFISDIQNGLWNHIAASTKRIFIGIGLATVIATPLGILIGQSRRLNTIVSPFIYIIYPVPKILFFPLILLVIGFGDNTKIFLIFLVLFFQILVMTRDAASSVTSALVFSLKSLGANKWQLWRFIYIPACLPTVMSSIRVSTSTAIAVLFMAESFGTQYGLGHYIVDEAWTLRNYTKMYAGILVFSLIGITLYLILDWAERVLCPWIFEDMTP